MRRLLLAASWLLGAGVLAGVVLRWWLGDRLFLTRYTGYVMPWLLLLVAPGAVAALVHRRWALAALLGISATIIAATHARLFLARPPPGGPAAVTLTVMSFNTWSENADTARLAAVILERRPDVLLLQEIRPEVFAGLAGALSGLYGGAPVHRVHDRALLQGIVSRYEIEPPSRPALRNALRAVLRTPAGPITVYNLHALRHGGWRGRYSKVRALLEGEVLGERGPVILGGDLNAPERSQLYDLLDEALVSAHGARGFGFGFTWPAHLATPIGTIPALPLVRIDHLFSSRHFSVVRAGTIGDSGGSDHLPVFAELALRAAAPARGAPDAQGEELAPARAGSAQRAGGGGRPRPPALAPGPASPSSSSSIRYFGPSGSSY